MVSSDQNQQYHDLAHDEGAFFSDPVKYRCLVGRLVYLAVTRPDLSYAVHILARFLQQPRQKHWDAAIRLVRYLKKSPGQGILLRADNSLNVLAYSDSDWAACPMTRRSNWLHCYAWSFTSLLENKEATHGVSFFRGSRI